MKRVAAENEKQLREEIEAKREKIGEPREKVSDISFNLDSAMEVETETGTATQTVLQTVLQYVSKFVLRKSPTLSQFQEFVLTLMKLKLNMPMQDLAYRFGISIATVSRTFYAWMVVFDARLAFLIRWPEREDLWQTMPQCFQVAFGNKTTVIIDCFEVFINRPSNLMARAQTYSNYKNHNTVKILVGITPQGSISFASNAWGGRTYDKFLTNNCGILKKPLPGDLVMADGGFTIQESLIFHGAKLAIPAFTRGKDPWHCKCPNTRGKDNWSFEEKVHNSFWNFAN